MRRVAENELLAWLARPNRKPLVLRGARQVGKSTLVRRVAEAARLPLWEINLERHPQLRGAFESLNVARILLELSLVTGQAVGKGPGVLFLDEIQATPPAIAALRYFFEDQPGLPVIAAGSLLEFAIGSLAAPMPVGRVDFFHLGPTSFSEFLEAAEGAPLADFLRRFKLGDVWSDTVQETALHRVRDFMISGAMPEAAALFAKRADPQAVHSVHRSILETYREDFGKYARGAEFEKVRRVFDFVPAAIGKQLRWSRVNPAWKSVDVRRAFDRLESAGVVTGVRHSDGTGVPLGATADDRAFKVLFLDVGLAQTAMNLPPLALEDFRSIRFVNEGPLAEQFVGQHLRFLRLGHPPELYYWRREGRAGNAEVDFLIQVDARVVPVEVKANAAGTLRSLHQFVAERGVDVAVRFDLNPPSIQDIATTVTTPSGPKEVRYRLLSLPLALVERTAELVRSV